MDRLNQKKQKIVRKKKNKPIVQLVPIENDSGSLFGRMKGTVRVVSDILSPIHEVWNASCFSVYDPT